MAEISGTLGRADRVAKREVLEKPRRSDGGALGRHQLGRVKAAFIIRLFEPALLSVWDAVENRQWLYPGLDDLRH